MRTINLTLTRSFLFLLLAFSCSQQVPEGPWFATGIKIGEIGQNEAIVWVRLTAVQHRVGNDAPMPEVSYTDPGTGELVNNRNRSDLIPQVVYPEGYDIQTV